VIDPSAFKLMAVAEVIRALLITKFPAQAKAAKSLSARMPIPLHKTLSRSVIGPDKVGAEKAREIINTKKLRI
jgi:hypothetical protein